MILYEKIRQKTNTKEDEGKAAKRAFKYFDVEDKGVINLQQFANALDKFGCVFTKNEVHALFKKFDVQGNGNIAYDEFCGFLAAMGSGNQLNINPVFELARQPPLKLIDQIRAELRKRGVTAFRKFTRAFYRWDKL